MARGPRLCRMHQTGRAHVQTLPAGTLLVQGKIEHVLVYLGTLASGKGFDLCVRARLLSAKLVAASTSVLEDSVSARISSRICAQALSHEVCVCRNKPGERQHSQLVGSDR